MYGEDTANTIAEVVDGGGHSLCALALACPYQLC
jgi:hypothetical protein